MLYGEWFLIYASFSASQSGLGHCFLAVAETGFLALWMTVCVQNCLISSYWWQLEGI